MMNVLRPTSTQYQCSGMGQNQRKFVGMPKIPDLVDASRGSIAPFVSSITPVFGDYASSGLVAVPNQSSLNANAISSGINSRIMLTESSQSSPPNSNPNPNSTNSTKEESPKSSAIRSTGERSSSSSSTVASSSLRDSAADAQYISANCVVFTYFSGDTSSVVDEHFSRALNQQNYNSSDKSNKDSTLPMSHRSFPPSFWNINHQPVHHHPTHTSSHTTSLCIPPAATSSANAAQVHELYASAAADAYHHHPTALHPTLHHQNDPWHYTLSASAASNPYTAHHHHHHHRAAASAAAIHDLSYSSASNRFNAQYSSLLLQPASMRSRLTPVSATCTGFEKTPPDMNWPTTARYHHDTMNFAGHYSMDATNYSASAAYGAAMSAAMSGLENQVQDTSKDLYWF